jgi:hypothetical protein
MYRPSGGLQCLSHIDKCISGDFRCAGEPGSMLIVSRPIFFCRHSFHLLITFLPFMVRGLSVALVKAFLKKSWKQAGFHRLIKIVL